MTPEDFDRGSRIFELIGPAFKWLCGTVAAAWLAVKWTLRQGVLVGEEKQRYKDLIKAVDKLNSLDLDSLLKTVQELKVCAPLWITRPQHDEMTKFCQGEIERMVEHKMYKVVLEYRDELSSLNANICHIMGALNLRPVDQGKRRRQTDTGDDN